MLNWDDPLSTPATKPTPQVANEPQTLAESYARSDVLDGMIYPLFLCGKKALTDVN